jgi:hypothetical protein
MKNPKAIFGILLIFILGAVCGVLVTHSIQHSRFESFIKGGHGAHEEMFVKRLTSKLDLDSRQQEQVRVIVKETHSGISQVRSQIRPRIESLLEQGQVRISAVLRPDQQEKFRTIIAERKARKSAERP